MNITLMAHDKKKELMVQFCTAYKSVLSKHNLSATATTGRLVAEATGLPVTLYLSHNQGGHQQVDARIAYNEIDLVLLFTDPNNSDPWEDQQCRRCTCATRTMCPWPRTSPRRRCSSSACSAVTWTGAR